MRRSKDFRNDAGHGDKEINESRWTDTRQLIYREPLFACIIDLSDTFDECRRRHEDLMDQKRRLVTDAEQQELAELDAFFVDRVRNRDKLELEQFGD